MTTLSSRSRGHTLTVDIFESPLNQLWFDILAIGEAKRGDYWYHFGFMHYQRTPILRGLLLAICIAALVYWMR